VTVTGADGTAVKVEKQLRGLPLEPKVRIPLPRVVPDARRVRISVRKVDVDSFVHLRELKLLAPEGAPEKP